MTRLLAVLMLTMGLSAQAQMTMADAVENAVRNYPSVRVSQEQINAAAAGIQLARTAYLPKIDAIALGVDARSRAGMDEVVPVYLARRPSWIGQLMGRDGSHHNEWLDEWDSNLQPIG
jgi:hypothetical protein